MAATSSGSTPMDTANAGNTPQVATAAFETPHFVSMQGFVPLDYDKDAIQAIGDFLYVPANANTITDTGDPGNAGYLPGITNQLAMRLTAVERRMMLLFGKNSNETVTDTQALVGQKYLAPMVKRIIELETVVAAHGASLQSMIGSTQAAVVNEMQKVKTVIDNEVGRVNDITTNATGQMKALETIREEWKGTSKNSGR